MKKRVSVVCHRIRTDDRLLWTQSTKKWRVQATNHTSATVYLSWCENFTNPFTGELWIARIDTSATAGERLIVGAENLECASFYTSGSPEHLIAPERFLQIAIGPDSTALWTMERIKPTEWDDFNVYEQSLVHTIQALGQVPAPVENLVPKVKGWPL